MRPAYLLATLAVAAATAGCGNDPIVPNRAVTLTSGTSVALSGVVEGALAVAAIYFIYDPLAPNWEIKENRLSEDTYRLSMTMKRYHTGGSGESMQLLKRRAQVLQAQEGYGSWQLVDFSEGIESQTLGARRVAEGTIRLVQRPAADSFLQNQP